MILGFLKGLQVKICAKEIQVLVPHSQDTASASYSGNFHLDTFEIDQFFNLTFSILLLYKKGILPCIHHHEP